MRITLSYSDAYKLDPAGRTDREYAARELFTDAGIKLDQSRCWMVWAGNDPALAKDRVRQSLRDIVPEWQDGDLAYIDHEPDNYNLSKKFDHSVANTQRELIDAAKFALPGDNNVSIYGYPYSRWHTPWSTPQAVYGANYLHKSTKLGWFGPQFYQPYNAGDKNGIDNLKRALTMKNVCESISPTTPMIPFVQPVIRHPDHDYQRMTDETIFDMWSSLAWAGVRRVVWWYESGAHGQLHDIHKTEIKRHAEIMQDAIASAFPVGG